MINEILYAGFGGQGVVLGALVTAHIALKADMNVTNMPNYGAEQRGGAACSDTKFAAPEEEIYDPRMEHPNVLVSMNEAAIIQYGKICRDGCITLFNTDVGSVNPSDYPHLKIYEVPCNKIADEVKSPRSANFVMMGAAMKLTGWFTREYCAECIADYFTKAERAKFIESNVRAFNAGYDFIK